MWRLKKKSDEDDFEEDDDIENDEISNHLPLVEDDLRKIIHDLNEDKQKKQL